MMITLFNPEVSIHRSHFGSMSEMHFLNNSLNKSPFIDTYSYGGVFTVETKKLNWGFMKAGIMQFLGGFQNKLAGSGWGQSAVNC